MGGRLLERDAELSALRSAISRVLTGNGEVVALQGTAGIGKTRLLAEVVSDGRAAGMHVLLATASRLEYDHPFGLARQLLERDVVRRSRAERDRLLDGPARLGAQVLSDHAEGPAVPDPSPGSIHGLYWIVANLTSEVPLLIAVDDVQWSDPSSLQFLAYLARRVADLPVLLVAAARLEQHADDPQSFGALFDAAGRTTLRPAPLSEHGIRQLLGDGDADAVPTEVAHRLHVQTGGNPFLVGELARTPGQMRGGPVRGAPDTVSRAILGRIRDVGPEATRLVGAVVALDDGCVLAEAAAVAGLEPGSAAAFASALMRADVLATADTLGFAHPLVRTAVEEAMTPVERSTWHATAARVLGERGAARERVALQWVHSSPSGDHHVARALAAAGHEALAKGAPQAAERFLQRALDEGPSEDQLGAVLEQLGASRIRTDRFAEAALELRRARELSRNDTELLDRTLLLWLALIGTGAGAAAVAEGVEVIESAIARLSDREARLMLESEFVNVSFLDPSRLKTTWERLARFADLAGETPAERRLLSMTTISLQYASTETAETMADIARRAYGDGKLIDESTLDPTKWFWAVEALILTDQLDEAEAALQRGAASAAGSGSLTTLFVVDDLRSLLWLRRGRVADAGAEVRDALERMGDAARTPVRRSVEIALVRWGLLALTARGEFAQADAMLARHDLAGEVPSRPREIRLLNERAVLRLAQRRPQEALADISRLADFHRSYEIDSIVEAPWRVLAALAHAALHDPTAATETAEENLHLARRWGLPRDVGIALRTRAQVEPDLDGRIELLEQALTLHRAAPAPLELAETATILGATLRRSGRRTESRDLLGEALEQATRCGASVLAGRARDELRLAGGEPRVRAVTGVDALTPGELRIAQLAAEGLSNREIAQELFLSVRTAENTLRRVYQKLSITSRRSLAGAMKSGSTLLRSDGDHL